MMNVACGLHTPECEAHVRESMLADRRETGFVNALRVHNALTANPEKRLLLWLAERTPRTINSDHLTALGFAAQLLAGACYAFSARHAWALLLANLFIILNWLGDSLDGTLARYRKQPRPRYGFYVDHMADTFGALALMAGLACSGYIHWQIAAGMLGCFYILSIESYLATYTMGHFHLSQGIFGPTELRLLLIAGNFVLLANRYTSIAEHRFLLFDVGGAVAIIAMAVLAIRAALRHTLVLYREDTVE